MKSKLVLPPEAGAFLQTHEGRHGEKVVRIFHGWLRDRNLALRDLAQHHVEEFLAGPAGRPLKPLVYI